MHDAQEQGIRRGFGDTKPKDLIGIPWSVAFALRADGWYLRSDIIWHKPNPMPESVTDRPTRAHEYLFLLSKSERYFYDADAIREACVSNGGASFGKIDNSETVHATVRTGSPRREKRPGKIHRQRAKQTLRLDSPDDGLQRRPLCHLPSEAHRTVHLGWNVGRRLLSNVSCAVEADY